MMRSKINAEQLLNVLSSAAALSADHLLMDGNLDLSGRLRSLSDALLELQDEYGDVIREMGKTAEDAISLECSVDSELLAQIGD